MTPIKIEKPKTYIVPIETLSELKKKRGKEAFFDQEIPISLFN